MRKNIKVIETKGEYVPYFFPNGDNPSIQILYQVVNINNKNILLVCRHDSVNQYGRKAIISKMNEQIKKFNEKYKIDGIINGGDINAIPKIFDVEQIKLHVDEGYDHLTKKENVELVKEWVFTSFMAFPYDRMYGKKINPGLLDHIFGKKIKLIGKVVLDNTINDNEMLSDHYPLLASFAIN